MVTELPVTDKLPPIFTLPPKKESLATPMPPVTTNAPVPAEVDAVALVTVVAPLAVNVVNAPVLAVLAPTVVPLILPPVITALAVAKFVNVPKVAPMFATALMYPPLITALPVLKLVACKVVAPNDEIPLILPPVICTLPELKLVTTAVVKLPVPANCVAFNTPVLGLIVHALCVYAAPLPEALSTTCG